jgi:hypothetical protein
MILLNHQIKGKSMKLFLVLATCLVLSANEYSATLNSQVQVKDQNILSKDIKLDEVKQRGCCSWHGGVGGCSNGKIVCNDGTYSPSCTCAIPVSPLG